MIAFIIFFTILLIVSSGRCDGLFPSAVVPRSSSLGSIPGQDIVLCSWSRHFTITVPDLGHLAYILVYLHLVSSDY